MRRECLATEDSGEHMALRISSVFVVLLSSLIGVMVPLVSSKFKGWNCPRWIFFFAKYFGSGVIIATAFIHLLFEAHTNLSSPCLPEAFQSFPYAFGIALLGIFGTFLIELMATHHVNIKYAGSRKHTHGPSALASGSAVQFGGKKDGEDHGHEIKQVADEESGANSAQGEGVLAPAVKPKSDEAKLASQLSKIFLLEFGIVFHSIFVGLTVAVSGPEFKTLYPVIVFHQMFEGLGLGARLESTPWPKSKEWVSWLFAVMFSVTTPLGIAIGLGIRNSFELNSPRALITNGVFDAISAGILIYTSLVELMGAEFLYSDDFKDATLFTIMSAYGWMGLGAFLMALIGAWA